jgi:Cytochrome C oxidase, cbb3-type, subunit III
LSRTTIPSAAVFVVVALASLPARAADIVHGQKLYEAYCLPCHGFPPSGGAEFAAGNPSRLQDAINGKVAPMVFLRTVVNSADVADIAAYLASLSVPPPPNTIVPAFNFSDLWWNESESGWGLNLVQHASGQVFGVMYTYEAPDRPLWLVIPGGTWSSSMQFTGTLYRATGPLIGAFDPTKVTVSAVGNATITFSDKDHGVLGFTINGATVTKSITRQSF